MVARAVAATPAGEAPRARRGPDGWRVRHALIRPAWILVGHTCRVGRHRKLHGAPKEVPLGGAPKEVPLGERPKEALLEGPREVSLEERSEGSPSRGRPKEAPLEGPKEVPLEECSEGNRLGGRPEGSPLRGRINSNHLAWDQSRRFAWDQSNALKRELWPTAKARTLVDSFAWDGSRC
ncbi:hypothetical protein BN2475_710028 [Paraburkholderia ribeironis]|uniref:Uncharacterized protein n=1 Tax=Paraburkholderia ribeironis TaxID=1247936 RepID=A0A1N7SIC5_9BURK|nr:hypothetical protein BN2475_710028 [Paraburkholderia ribeironis]